MARFSSLALALSLVACGGSSRTGATNEGSGGGAPSIAGSAGAGGSATGEAGGAPGHAGAGGGDAGKGGAGGAAGHANGGAGGTTGASGHADAGSGGASGASDGHAGKPSGGGAESGGGSGGDASGGGGTESGPGGAAQGGGAGGASAGTSSGGAAGKGGGTSKAACSTGATMSNSGGLEGPLGTAVVNLCRRAVGCDTTWTPAAPKPLDGGTPNQKLLWHVWDYGYARLSNDAPAIATARADLVGFFQGQETYGQYAPSANANEVLTTSHYEIWANGTTCARLLAVVYGDANVLAATGAWWHGERALYDLLQRGGSIDAPGARVDQGGPSQLRDVVYAMLRGAALTGNPGNPTSAWWSDYYNVGAWQLRELLRLGDDVGGATSPVDKSAVPKLRDPLYVRTKGDDWVFEFPQMRGALDPLFWVAHIGGTTTYGMPQEGTPVTSPMAAPALPGADVFVVPGTP